MKRLNAHMTHALFVAILSSLFVVLPGYTGQAMAVETAAEPLCRFGVNHNPDKGDIASFDLAPLAIGWYIDYTVNSSTQPPGMEQFRVIRLTQNGDDYSFSPSAATLTNLAQAKPGSAWVVGNEPDRIDYQDDIEPQIYARAYHEIYAVLKQADPTAQVVAGNIVQATPLRLKYLTIVVDSYRSLYDELMPVDAWGIHAFILNEASCKAYPASGCWGAEIPPGLSETEGWVLQPQDTARFDLLQSQITSFRKWMAAQGYRDIPLYVTEYGVLLPEEFGFPVNVVNDYMNQTFDYFRTTTDSTVGYPADENRLVQRFSWYSINDKFDAQDRIGHNGWLFDPDLNNQRSLMGDNFAIYAAQVVAETDLLTPRVLVTPPAPLSASGPATVTVTAEVANGGNTVAGKGYTVRLYNGNPTKGGELLPGAEFTGSVAGCGDRMFFDYTWKDVPPGQYEIFAVVTPGSGVVDVDPSNNQAQTTLLFASEQLFMPSIARGQ